MVRTGRRGPTGAGPSPSCWGAHLPVAPGCHMRTGLLPAWLPGSSPAAALHPGPALGPCAWVLRPGVHVGHEHRAEACCTPTHPADPGQSPGAGLLSRKRGRVGWSYLSIRIAIPRSLPVLHQLGRCRDCPPCAAGILASPACLPLGVVSCPALARLACPRGGRFLFHPLEGWS